MLTVDASDLARLSRNLKAYKEASRKDWDEILNKKGNDLRIQLFKLFRKAKWKGGKRIAERELIKRTRSGQGTLVRLKYLTDRYSGSAPGTDKNGKPLNRWQQLVWQEIQRRQHGIGVLGVGFLQKRWRYKKDSRYLVEQKSRTLGTLVRFEKTPEAFTITGFTPGLAQVASKYGIIPKALAAVSADIEIYLKRKLGETAKREIYK
jgi:hypothetical protein